MSDTNPATTPADVALATLVAQTCEARMQAGELFTALDISNALKARRFSVRHREVSPLVRDFVNGAMAQFGYTRRSISVYADGGTTEARANLYLPQTADPDDYTTRVQDALPPVNCADARDLLDATPSGNPLPPA